MREVKREAVAEGWRVYHTFDPRNSDAGFPDLIMLRGDVLLVVELKRDKTHTSPAQVEWLRAFAKVRVVHVGVWRPKDRAGYLSALRDL